MIKFVTLAFAAFLASSAFADAFTASFSMACTRDYNAWGRASSCQCPSDATYDARVGSCLKGELGYARLEGYIAPEINRAGVTIGYTLTTDSGEVFVVVAPVALRAQFEDSEYRKQRVECSGDIVEKSESDINRPAILILDSVENSSVL